LDDRWRSDVGQSDNSTTLTQLLSCPVSSAMRRKTQLLSRVHHHIGGTLTR
jgi:hypothetical protein